MDAMHIGGSTWRTVACLVFRDINECFPAKATLGVDIRLESGKDTHPARVTIANRSRYEVRTK